MQKQFLILLLLISSNFLLAQTPTLDAVVSKTNVTENEIFTYQIISNSECEITPPDFGNLEIVDGPVQGVSKNSDYTNNVHVTEYSFTYYLSAPKKGNYTIPPATMKCKMKKEISSQKTITIKAVAAKDAVAEKQSGDHFLKLTTNKNSVYIGEPFILSLKFYTTKRPNNFEPVMVGNASGLWRADLNPGQDVYTMPWEFIKLSLIHI